MQAIAKFVVKNEDFRAWLEAGMPENIVFIDEYKKKKTASAKTATRKKTTTNTTSSIPDGVA